MADPNGYLLRFEDGPLCERGNVNTLAGPGGGNLVIPRTLFGWPLPDRLGVMVEDDQVGLFEPLAEVAAAVGSPFVVYTKLSESQLPDDSASHVMRGALYKLEVDAEPAREPNPTAAS